MCVHFSKPQVHDRRGLKGMQDLIAADAACSKLLEQLDCFSRRHPGKMGQKSKNPSAKSQPPLPGSDLVSANEIVSLDMMAEKALTVFQKVPND
jgi:hypothetical protein